MKGVEAVAKEMDAHGFSTPAQIAGNRIDVEENQQITIHYRFATPLLIAG